MTEVTQETGASAGAGKGKLSDSPTAPNPPPTVSAAPSLGRIVIVREAGKNDAPGIIAEVFEDTITCNVFRGDHLPHVATQLTRIDPGSAEPEGGATGWFWPPRV